MGCALLASGEGIEGHSIERQPRNPHHSVPFFKKMKVRTTLYPNDYCIFFERRNRPRYRRESDETQVRSCGLNSSAVSTWVCILQPFKNTRRTCEERNTRIPKVRLSSSAGYLPFIRKHRISESTTVPETLNVTDYTISKIKMPKKTEKLMYIIYVYTHTRRTHIQKGIPFCECAVTDQKYRSLMP